MRMPTSSLFATLACVAVACGGRSGLLGPSETSRGDAGFEGPLEDAGGGPGVGGATCQSPPVVAVGASLSGTTCGGGPLQFHQPCVQDPTDVAYFLVDDPSGGFFDLESSSPLEWFGLYSCAHLMICSAGESSTFGSDVDSPNLRLIAVSQPGGCGPFTISVAAQ